MQGTSVSQIKIPWENIAKARYPQWIAQIYKKCLRFYSPTHFNSVLNSLECLICIRISSITPSHFNCVLNSLECLVYILIILVIPYHFKNASNSLECLIYILIIFVLHILYMIVNSLNWNNVSFNRALKKKIKIESSLYFFFGWIWQIYQVKYLYKLNIEKKKGKLSN